MHSTFSQAVTSCPDCSDEAAVAAADAAGLAARYQQAQGLYPQAESAQRAVLTLRLRVQQAPTTRTH